MSRLFGTIIKLGPSGTPLKPPVERVFPPHVSYLCDILVPRGKDGGTVGRVEVRSRQERVHPARRQVRDHGGSKEGGLL